MKYDVDKLFSQSIELVDKHKLIFAEDVIALLPCGRTTFYVSFPEGSDYSNKIKEKLEQNRVIMKVNLRKKWYDSDNATLQLALYKLIANPQELAALTNYKPDEAPAEKIEAPNLNFNKSNSNKMKKGRLECIK